MPIVQSRYRGKTVYYHVHAQLVRAAEYRGITTYQDIALIMALPISGSHMGAQTGHILGEIVEDKVNAGRPMLSAVAVGVNGKPGPRFFTLARELGRSISGNDERAFWASERDRVYDAWKRPIRPGSDLRAV
jgi:hypothetical protein